MRLERLFLDTVPMNVNVHSKLYLCELEVDKAEEKFYVGDTQVHRVDIIGTIVYLSLRERATIFKLDDSTGMIQCTQFPEYTNPYQDQSVATSEENALDKIFLSVITPKRELGLGDLVNIKGRLNIFRDEPQIIVNNIRYISNVNEEWFRWREIAAVRSSSKVQQSKISGPCKRLVNY